MIADNLQEQQQSQHEPKVSQDSKPPARRQSKIHCQHITTSEPESTDMTDGIASKDGVIPPPPVSVASPQAYLQSDSNSTTPRSSQQKVHRRPSGASALVGIFRKQPPKEESPPSTPIDQTTSPSPSQPKKRKSWLNRITPTTNNHL